MVELQNGGRWVEGFIRKVSSDLHLPVVGHVLCWLVDEYRKPIVKSATKTSGWLQSSHRGLWDAAPTEAGDLVLKLILNAIVRCFKIQRPA